MNKKILSILAITFCAGCGLFADDIVETQTVEVVTIEEATACCDKSQENSMTIACNCGGNPKKKTDPEARCGKKRPTNPEVLACSCGCDKCAEAIEEAEAAKAEGTLACCGTCGDQVETEEGTLAGCGCGKDKNAAVYEQQNQFASCKNCGDAAVAAA
jgi:hypothetical protein